MLMPIEQNEPNAMTDPAGVDAVGSLKTLARSAGIVLVGLVASKLLTYLYKVIIARSGADFFGTFSIGYAVFDVVSMLAGVGMAVGLYRFVPEYVAKKDNPRLRTLLAFAIRVSLIASVFAAVALFLSADWLSQRFFHGDAQVALVTKVLALAVPFFVLENVFVAILQGFKRMDRVSIAKNIVENALKVGAAFIALQLGFHLLGLSVGFVVASMLAFSVSLLFVHQDVYPLSNIQEVTPGVGQEMLAYSLPYLLAFALSSIVTWTDTIFLGHFRTAAETGIYNAALTTSLFMLLAPGIIASLNVQVLVELQSLKKKADMQRVYRTVSKWIFFLNFPLFLFIAVFSWQIMSVLYGGEYAAGGLSLLILSAGYLVYTVSQPAVDVFAVFKKTKLAFLNSALAAVLTVALNWYLVPRWGMVGAAAASSTAFTVFALMEQVQVYRIARLQPLSRDYLKAITASVPSAGIVFLIVRHAAGTFRVWELAGAALAYAGIYLLFLFLLHAFDETDVELLKSAEGKLGLKFLSPVRAWAKKYYYPKKK